MVAQELNEPLVTLSDIADVLPAESFKRELEPIALKRHENRHSIVIGIRNTTIILTIVFLHLAQLSHNALTGITTGINWTSTHSQIMFSGEDSINPSMQSRPTPSLVFLSIDAIPHPMFSDGDLLEHWTWISGANKYIEHPISL
jgi:hypothetical protein